MLRRKRRTQTIPCRRGGYNFRRYSPTTVVYPYWTEHHDKERKLINCRIIIIYMYIYVCVCVCVSYQYTYLYKIQWQYDTTLLRSRPEEVRNSTSGVCVSQMGSNVPSSREGNGRYTVYSIILTIIISHFRIVTF